MKKKTNKAPTAAKSPLTLSNLLTFDNGTSGYFSAAVRLPRFYLRTGEQDPYAAVKAIDEAVVAVANVAELTDEEFGEFLNSRAGLWLGDALARKAIENRKEPHTETIGKYMYLFLCER